MGDSYPENKIDNIGAPVGWTVLSGNTYADFDIAAVDDGAFDGDQTVTITATASGYLDGTDTVVVTDDEIPSEPEGRYDFGTASSPVETDYLRVSHGDAYSAAAGYGWSDWARPAIGRWLAPIGFMTMASLVALGPYPISMIGLDDQAITNTVPPTVALLALAVMQAGLVGLAMRRLRRWLDRRTVWTGVVLGGGMAMSWYAWHLTVMALYTGLRAPQVFGRVLSQSAALDMSKPDSVVFDLVRHGPLPPLRIWLNVGRYEWLLDGNRRMHGLLGEKGYDLVYREYNGGHNYPSWRDQVGAGLEVMFGA